MVVVVASPCGGCGDVRECFGQVTGARDASPVRHFRVFCSAFVARPRPVLQLSFGARTFAKVVVCLHSELHPM